LGINVTRVRYLCVVVGGVLAGVGGGFLSVAYRPSWTEGMSGGLGWIALAITIFAAWDPVRVVGGAVFFGALFHLSFRLQGAVAPELLRMMPFASTIVVLALTARQRRGQGGPEALGMPYTPGER
jgi:simple sugar transport system permease protein